MPLPTTTVICVLETMAHDPAFVPDAGALPIFALHVCVITKFDPVIVTVEPTYAEEGLTLVLNTVNALLLVTAISLSTFIIVAVPALLLIVISTPAAPTGVESPMTTLICVVETMVQEAVAVPDDGVLPILAVHLPTMNSESGAAVKVMVLPAVPKAAGLMLGNDKAGFTVREASAKFSFPVAPSKLSNFKLVPEVPYVTDATLQPYAATYGLF